MALDDIGVRTAISDHQRTHGRGVGVPGEADAAV